MITSQPRSSLIPPIIRHFEFTRLQDHFVEIAYQSLIPVVSRRPGRPKSRCGVNERATFNSRSRRSKAGGA
jgi:hypothetical protein